jgi:hypothetical protein
MWPQAAICPRLGEPSFGDRTGHGSDYKSNGDFLCASRVGKESRTGFLAPSPAGKIQAVADVRLSDSAPQRARQ